jgi:ABC-type uncharacterized transport system substrate-binding protein
MTRALMAAPPACELAVFLRCRRCYGISVTSSESEVRMPVKPMARLLSAMLAMWALTVTSAAAHPHVWVTMKTELVYGAGGTVTGVRHAWFFDDMYSTFAVQGLEPKEQGVYTTDELADLAKTNVEEMKEFEYFTYARVNSETAAFADPTDYAMELKDGVLTLRFTLPLAKPVKAKALDVDVFDPTYLVDFSFVDAKAVTLIGAPAGCKLDVTKLTGPSQSQPLSEAFFNSPDGGASKYGAMFANKVAVRCP